MERKVFLEVRHRRLFPNLYTVLVGPSGVGKTSAIVPVRELLQTLPHLHLAPPKTTTEKFTQIVAGALKVDNEVDSMTHCSISCVIDELASFIVPGDQNFTIILTNLFDCPTHWEYTLISRTPTVFENAYVSILGAITPTMLPETLGMRALGLGFTSRVIFIYSEDRIKRVAFPKSFKPDMSALIEDLSRIYNIRGEYSLTKEAVDAVETWIENDMPPIPLDLRFETYNARRESHWLKLSLLLAAGRRDNRLITLEDVNDARTMMLEAEETMPLALEAFGHNPMLDTIKRVHRWALVEYHSHGKQPLDEMHIHRQLLATVPPNYLLVTLQSMLTSGLFVHVSGTYPHRTFTPVPKT